jgi:hypothetical protein
LDILQNKWALNTNIFMTIALIIILFFAAPIVLPHSVLLAALIWVFAGWYTLSTITLIIGQWLMESIKENER